MRPLRRPGHALTLLAALLAASPAGASAADSAGKTPAANAASPVVTAKNLLENDRYWPFHVALVEAWRPSDSEPPIAKGTRGVLIRVENSGAARIDFGRAGLHVVPVAKTDLLERANEIRENPRATKQFPNFLLSLGPRMVDPLPMQAPGPARLTAERFFVCVFADPEAPDFAGLAKSLVALPGRTGAARVLFPLGSQTDASLGKQLRELGWGGLFVYSAMAREYALTLLPEQATPPFVQLVTNEGRVVFEGPMDATGLAKLESALEAALRSETSVTTQARGEAP